MVKILSIYLRDPALEDLAYVNGYCGEFLAGIYQKAGPRLMPGTTSMSVYFIYTVTATDWLDTLGFFDNGNNYDRDRAWRRRRDDLDQEAALHRAGYYSDTAHQHTSQPTSAAYTRVRRPVQPEAQANTIAGPSNQPGNDMPGEFEPSPTQTETELLTRLANGSGLSPYDRLGFLETCTRCGNLFLGSFLGRHLTSCTHK